MSVRRIGDVTVGARSVVRGAFCCVVCFAERTRNYRQNTTRAVFAATTQRQHTETPPIRSALTRAFFWYFYFFKTLKICMIFCSLYYFFSTQICYILQYSFLIYSVILIYFIKANFGTIGQISKLQESKF